MNIVVVGSGYWGKNLVRNFDELGSLYGICEIDPVKREEFAQKYSEIVLFDSFDKVLADKNINGVAIATPAPTHFELAKKALESGMPTYVEKPITLNLRDAEILTQTAEEKNIPLMVGHILEYHPAIAKMKELVNEGVLGKIKHIRCTRINLGKVRSNENIWWSFAPHDLSIIFTLLDEEPVRLQASSFKPIQDNINDTVFADLTFKDGQSAHIHVSWLEPDKLHQTVVIGEKAMLVFNDTLKENKLMLHKYSYDPKEPLLNKINVAPVEYEEGQPLKIECQHFIDCVKDNKTPKTDGRSACRIIKVIEQVDNLIKS